MLMGMADISTIRVPSGYEREFPGASRSAAEIAANLVRAATEFLTEIDRPTRKAAGLSARGFQTLAILDGAGGPLPGYSIAEQMLISSASMTSLLDTLQRRALIERHPHPTDRRKVLIHLTDDGQRIVDQQLPAIHAVITQALIARIDAIAKDIPDFHFGRFDVRYTNLPALRRGEDFSIIEINGVGSEATHIWDPATRLAAIWGDQLRHYGAAWAIGAAMRRRGARPSGLRAMYRDWRLQRRLMRSYPIND